MLLVFIPVIIIIAIGFILALVLTVCIQFPIWFVCKGKLLEENDSLFAWYIWEVVGSVYYFWKSMLEWSRE
jgi:hypothetical protein